MNMKLAIVAVISGSWLAAIGITYDTYHFWAIQCMFFGCIWAA